jgi:hypothetical protein
MMMRPPLELEVERYSRENEMSPLSRAVARAHSEEATRRCGSEVAVQASDVDLAAVTVARKRQSEHNEAAHTFGAGWRCMSSAAVLDTVAAVTS